ncbi:hypothetical protein V8F06_014014 [Rhypophila decipiens]
MSGKGQWRSITPMALPMICWISIYLTVVAAQSMTGVAPSRVRASKLRTLRFIRAEPTAAYARPEDRVGYSTT